MTKNEVGDDIRFIREMLERTKVLTAQSWKYFYVWGVYRSNYLFFAGGLWWLGAFVMGFLPPDYRPLVSIVLLIVGYILPGCILSKKYKKELMNNG